MKPTAVFFTVISMLAGTSLVGCSFNTKDKIRTTTHEIPLKDENAATALLPDIKIASARKAVKPELIEVYIKSSICEALSADFGIIPPPVEEDSIGIKEDDTHVFLTCNLEAEAEYPGGTNAWMHYLHNNVQVPQEVIDNEIDTDVVVQFVVDEEGSVCEAKAISGSTVLGAEVVRVINQSNKWKPAKRISTDQCIRSIKRQPFKVCFETEE